MKSIPYLEVESYAKARDKELGASNFHNDTVAISLDDGSFFMFDSAIVEDYVCKADGQTWVCIFAEHYPPHVFSWDDVEGVRLMTNKHWWPPSLKDG